VPSPWGECRLASARAALVAGAIAAALALAGCPAQEQQKSEPRTTSAHLVTTMMAERSQVAGHHERPGTLRLRRLVRIHSQEEGRVTRLGPFEGDLVAADQELVTLDRTLLQAELDKARATREQKRLDLARLEGLVKRNAVSEDEIAQARTALTVAQAEERLLETRLAFTRIQAPFAGVVTQRQVEPGDFVAKDRHLLTLADPDSLVAEVFVSELILPLVKVGDPATVRIDALGDGRHQARVLRIHPTLAESSRQAIVELTLDPIPAGARAGQFVRATLDTAAVERLLVPFPALRRDRAGEFVWLADADGKASRRGVRSGLRFADRVEILEGLEPGEGVITRGFLGLAQGKAIRVVEQEDRKAGQPP
jgi:RND family efflux transporter MFP subunit